MNWLKLSLLIPFLNPLSPENQFQTRLIHALSLANIKYNQLNFREFQNEVEFQLVEPGQTPTTIILSTQKNPYWQISALQQVQKTSRIRHKIIRLVNLSLNHPYATLEDN